MKRMEKVSEKEITEDGLSDLIADLDAIFSQWVRLSACDKYGHLLCFICGDRIHWKEAENMHYIKRGASIFLRFDPRNNKAGCNTCNCKKEGNYVEYAKKLEIDSPGITDILFEESTTVYHYSRTELKELIADYTKKVGFLKEDLLTHPDPC